MNSEAADSLQALCARATDLLNEPVEAVAPGVHPNLTGHTDVLTDSSCDTSVIRRTGQSVE